MLKMKRKTRKFQQSLTWLVIEKDFQGKTQNKMLDRGSQGCQSPP